MENHWDGPDQNQNGSLMMVRRFPSIRRQDDDKHRQMILGRIWWMESDDDDLTYRDANGGMTDVPDTRRYKNKNNQKIQITRQRCCGGGGILISCSWVELWYIYYTLSWMMNGYTRLFDIRTSQDGCVFALLPVFCEALMSPATSVLPGIIAAATNE